MNTDHATKDRQLFNSIADKYCAKDLAGSSRLARRHRLLESLSVVPFGSGSSILEVGCGAGFSVDYLNGRFDRYVGVDYAEELIRYATAHHDRPGVEFHASDIRNFKCDPPCDIVVMIGVLHHFDNIPEIMSHIVRMVKPGGWLVANEPQPGNPVVELARRMRKSVDTSYSDDQVTLNGKQLRELCVGAGLTDVRIVPQGFASTPFAEVVLPPQILTRMMSAMACGFDKVIGKSTPQALLKSLSWNLIAAGRKV